MHNGRESDAPFACNAVNDIAAEKRYLATVDGFSLEQTRTFLKQVLDGSLPQLLGIVEDQVVGFCDIIPNTAKGFIHVGRLGMGVRSEWWRQGIGRRLLEACLTLARNTRIEKVELEVFSGNVGAVRLYESVGFNQEGLRVRGRKLEDRLSGRETDGLMAMSSRTNAPEYDSRRV